MAKEMIVVQSKVKDYIKSKDLHSSGDSVDALNDAVYELIDKAIARTKANKRGTVSAKDI